MEGVGDCGEIGYGQGGAKLALHLAEDQRPVGDPCRVERRQACDRHGIVRVRGADRDCGEVESRHALKNRPNRP